MKEVKEEVKLRKSTVVCINCFAVLDRVDELQAQFKVTYYKNVLFCMKLKLFHLIRKVLRYLYITIIYVI